MTIPEIIGRIRAAIEEKRQWQKKWNAHMARVKALPPDYQIVYKEIENYLFKVGPVELDDGTVIFSGIVDLFEEGAAMGKGVLEVTGSDVAVFCDDLVKGSRTFADTIQEAVDQEANQAAKKAAGKTK